MCARLSGREAQCPEETVVYGTSEGLSQGRHNEDRMRRADSWLGRSEKSASGREKARTFEEETGLDCERFIFLWIAFNAAYGRELIDDDEANPDSHTWGKVAWPRINETPDSGR